MFHSRFRFNSHGEWYAREDSNPLPSDFCHTASHTVQPAPTSDTLGHNDLQNPGVPMPPTASTRDTLQERPRVNETVERKSNGDPDFERLAALWPKLSAGERAAILTLAASLGAKQEGP